MAFSRGIHHLLAGALACLMVIGLSAAYWAIAGQDSLLLRDDNPRRIEALAAIRRGSIFDRSGQPLAETVAQAKALQRRYLIPSTFSAVGYFSLRFGASGAESAFDDLLAGSPDIRTLQDFVDRRLLNLPQTGSDIRLSIDAGLQDSLVIAMGESRGAAVVINATSGEILSLVSQPGVDANTLDDDWEDLVAADGQPFFNRALQGNYQLGGAIFNVLLAQAITSGFDLSQRFPQSAAPIEFKDGMTIACAIEPEATELTLTEAYAYGCPAPFQAYYLSEPRFDLDAILNRFAFDNPTALNGFPEPAPINLPVAPSAVPLDDADLEVRAALGQGDVTTTPLHMAAIMAALSTDGSLKNPYLQAATRLPGEQRWRMTSAETTTIPVISAETAQELRAVMRNSWSALQIYTDSVDVGAQVAISQSGEGAQLWLNGFVTRADGTAFSFVILLEAGDDLSRLLTIGQTLVRALDLL